MKTKTHMSSKKLKLHLNWSVRWADRSYILWFSLFLCYATFSTAVAQKLQKAIAVYFTVLLYIYLFCSYYSNYNNWVITNLSLYSCSCYYITKCFLRYCIIKSSWNIHISENSFVNGTRKTVWKKNVLMIYRSCWQLFYTV